jgi:D-beta-D-heptose 7-phosphate kinase/D-beta-D-heptose 1-phosphate adenosyltransferase
MNRVGKIAGWASGVSMIDLSAFSQATILCVGDVMLDRFVSGEVRRISPESPVPVLVATGRQDIPGGAANVSRNIAALGGRCILIGAVGDDAAGRELTELLSSGDGIRPELVRASHRPTAEKTRFVAHGQHMLRVDREDARPLPPDAESAVIAKVAELIGQAQALILSDYAKGVLTQRVIGECISLARRSGVPVIVDPKSPILSRYDGATVVTPNSAETAAATGIAPATDALAEEAGRKALEGATVSAVLITRAEHGMTLVDRAHGVSHFPASAREVSDVVGAGDTVVATLALALGLGWPLAEAARLANAAAGLAVGKHGTATVSPSELLDELDRLSIAATGHAETKFAGLHALAERRKEWAKERLNVGFTNGCFDILHIGHLQTLDFARRNCDRLIVAINSDDSVRRLKGPTRPINGAEDRAEMLAALSCVDAVVVFEEDTPAEIIEALQPDVLVKGADYGVHEIAGASTVLAGGGRVLTCPIVPGRSTTRIIEKSKAG